MEHILTILIFLPVVGSLGILALPGGKNYLYRWITFLISTINLGLSVWVYLNFNPSLSGISNEKAMQFVEKVDWITIAVGDINKIGIQYFVGLDGLNMPMVLLSALVLFIGAISAWNIKYKAKGFHSLFLLLSGSIIGCFAALDFFLFFLFFEFMLLPMYFLIGIWGGKRREYASIKFFIYTLVGSVCILLVMIMLAFSVQYPKDTYTFNLLALADRTNFIPDSLLNWQNSRWLINMPARRWAFLLLLTGFAIKLPAVPVHTWLPDAHVEAPTPISVILAGILLKIGGYGLLRIGISIFPDSGWIYSDWMAVLGGISIVYGALNAMASHDLKRMVAYSSVSHMGFVLIGIASMTSEGINGAMYQLFSHGILSAMLFLLVGVLQDRTHDKTIENYRGLATKMPVYTGMTIIAFFASLGLPGFSGFIGEFFTIMSTFGTDIIPRWVILAAVAGLVLGAAYFLWTLQRMFFGKYWSKGGEEWAILLTDLNLREKAMLIILAILALIFGIFPNLLFTPMSKTIMTLTDMIQKS
ncbi:NADH-quinone oxidoreductase subunit M [Xanthocytophaga agilis]|uniref:NADH-quinone oxidoreductase subunit M n=1 Tax=Xanthocytophaga agilis TaxID=3048010 RepID=A0AAE3R5J4_9BACT|nr:NADH-quinone oxidoreductase subunit M [Xanthocytophaga agilis]MDJ1504179.1 NADH-quinone oxidoreductase subunit M [Xanthocytophaga agilis]